MWGLNIPIMKHALRSMDALSFNAARLTLSVVALAVSLAWENHRSRKPPQTASWGSVILFAILSGYVYQVCFLLGIDRSTAGNTALIISSMPLWTAIMTYLFLHERLSRLSCIGLAISSPGVAAVILAKSQISVSSQHFTGNLLVLGAAMLWAGASVLSRPILRNISAMRLTLIASIVSLPLHYATAAYYSDLDFHELRSPSTLACVAYSGIFSTGLAYALWNYGVQQVGAPHAAIFQNFVPVIALLTSWSFLGETPLWSQWLGGALILGGIMVMRRGR